MKLLRMLSRERPLKMAWTIEMGERTCYLVGTAHFFPYRFRRAIAALLENVSVALFEGPLDDESLAEIAARGRTNADTRDLIDRLDEKAVVSLCRNLKQRLGCMSRDRPYFLTPPPGPDCLESYVEGMQPWMAYFSIWSTCLGWPYAVDHDAYQVACALGKDVRALETIDEQLDVLDGIPVARIVRQLNDVDDWPRFADRYREAYLAGELETLRELLLRYWKESRPAISGRDGVLFERIHAVFEEETAAAFVGFPHVPGLRRLFEERGHHVGQVPG